MDIVDEAKKRRGHIKPRSLRREDKIQVPVNEHELHRVNKLSYELGTTWADTFRRGLCALERELIQKK